MPLKTTKESNIFNHPFQLVSMKYNTELFIYLDPIYMYCKRYQFTCVDNTRCWITTMVCCWSVQYTYMNYIFAPTNTRRGKKVCSSYTEHSGTRCLCIYVNISSRLVVQWECCGCYVLMFRILLLHELVAKQTNILVRHWTMTSGIHVTRIFSLGNTIYICLVYHFSYTKIK